jgi:hypothetical protein
MQDFGSSNILLKEKSFPFHWPNKMGFSNFDIKKEHAILEARYHAMSLPLRKFSEDRTPVRIESKEKRAIGCSHNGKH